MRSFQSVLTVAFLALAFIGPARATDYQKMDALDIKLDGGKLEGKKVEVMGWIGTFNDHWLMHETQDGSPLFYVDTQFLPRDERKALLTSCAMRCRLVIRGSVDRVDFGEWGITADSVEVSR